MSLVKVSICLVSWYSYPRFIVKIYSYFEHWMKRNYPKTTILHKFKLNELPDNVLINVLTFAPKRTIDAFSRVNKRFYSLSESSILWRKKLTLDFECRLKNIDGGASLKWYYHIFFDGVKVNCTCLFCRISDTPKSCTSHVTSHKNEPCSCPLYQNYLMQYYNHSKLSIHEFDKGWRYILDQESYIACQCLHHVFLSPLKILGLLMVPLLFAEEILLYRRFGSISDSILDFFRLSKGLITPLQCQWLVVVVPICILVGLVTETINLAQCLVKNIQKTFFCLIFFIIINVI